MLGKKTRISRTSLGDDEKTLGRVESGRVVFLFPRWIMDREYAMLLLYASIRSKWCSIFPMCVRMYE